MPKIVFKEPPITLDVEEGTPILEAALENGVWIYHTCGGNASCSTCRVLILKGEENLSPIEPAEHEILDAFDLAPPHRLACQAQVLRGEVVVEIPQHEKPPRPNKTPRIPDS